MKASFERLKKLVQETYDIGSKRDMGRARAEILSIIQSLEAKVLLQKKEYKLDPELFTALGRLLLAIGPSKVFKTRRWYVKDAREFEIAVDVIKSKIDLEAATEL